MTIFHNGKQIRDNHGRFATHKKAAYAFFLVLLIGGAFYLGHPYVMAVIDDMQAENDELQRQNEINLLIQEKARYEGKIKEIKQDLLNTLSYECEVRGSAEPDGVIIFDANDKASIGKYQWQRESVKHYVKEFYQRDITNDEAIAIAIGWHPNINVDEFTLKVLFEVEGGWKNWKICSNKFNLEREIELIKKLENN